MSGYNPRTPTTGTRSPPPIAKSPKTRQLTQRETENSAHRLSRTPQIYSSKTNQTDKNETYATSFFKNHPEAVDIRPPNEKLDEIDAQIGPDLEPSELFTLLMKQKSLRYIVYGENSKESLESHLALGNFYNDQHRQESAIRHLEKAKSLSENQDIEIDDETQIKIAVSLAESHLDSRGTNKKLDNSHINAASKAIQPAANAEIEDEQLRCRRDLVKARILAARGRYDDSLQEYESALSAMDENSAEIAQVYTEIGTVYESNQDPQNAGHYYKKAYDLYNSLHMNESAELLENKLPDEEENENINSNDSNNQDQKNEEDNNEEDNNEEDNNEEEQAKVQDRNIAKMIGDIVADEYGEKKHEEENKNEENNHIATPILEGANTIADKFKE